MILLIDGNNLAHFLYTNLTPGQKMTPADAYRLITHLSSYARQHGQAVEIECCLDRPAKSDADLPDNLRILATRYPKTADELLLDRFWFHHYSRRPCLVITNDEAILDEVKTAQGSTMLVSTFVRRAGTLNPVFREPDDLPPVTILQAKAQETGSIPLSHPQQKQPPNTTTQPLPAQVKSGAVLSDSSRKARENKSDDSLDNSVSQNDPGDLPAQIPPGEPHYYLNLDTWPTAEGIKFLLASFCARHRAEVIDLFRSLDPADFTPADLQELTQLLLDTCTEEPDFVTRGGSLMDRVRLALLKAGGEDLSLTELVHTTGIKKHGLRGRIKAKAGRWIQILDEQ